MSFISLLTDELLSKCPSTDAIKLVLFKLCLKILVEIYSIKLSNLVKIYTEIIVKK